MVACNVTTKIKLPRKFPLMVYGRSRGKPFDKYGARSGSPPSYVRAEGAYLDQYAGRWFKSQVATPFAPTVPIQRAAMIPIELWRARIGHFNCKRVRSRLTSVPVSCNCSSLISSSASLVGRGTARSPRLGRPNNARQDCANNSPVLQVPSTFMQTNHGTERETNRQVSPTTSSAQNGFLLTLDISVARSLLIMVVIFQLLIVSGDIETNPGPKHDGKKVGVYLM